MYIPSQASQAVVDDPIRSTGFTRRGTQEAIKEILKDGTPDWFTHPEDYKQMARENYLRDKELSDSMAASYKMDDQELLIDEKVRKVNIIYWRRFLMDLDRHGVKTWGMYNGMPDTVGLWATNDPAIRAPKYICFMQVPYMCEWSVLRLDEHHMPKGEKFRGWRTVLYALVEKGILTEEKAHDIFGKPSEGIVSRRYRKSLHWLRNKANKN